MEKRARHTSTANGGGPAPMATTTTTSGGGGDATKPPNWGGVPDGMPTSAPPAPSAPWAATSPPPAPRSEEAIAMVKASHVKGETVAVPGKSKGEGGACGIRFCRGAPRQHTHLYPHRRRASPWPIHAEAA